MRLRQAGAFTLVEMLVVVAVVVVLIALLSPALKSAREQAYQTKCRSNQRQLAMVSRFHALDNNDVIVPRIVSYWQVAFDKRLTNRGSMPGTLMGSPVWDCPSNPSRLSDLTSWPDAYNALHLSQYCNFNLGDGEGPYPLGANAPTMPFPHQGLYRYRDAKRQSSKVFFVELANDPARGPLSFGNFSWGGSYFWHQDTHQSVAFLDGHGTSVHRDHELWIKAGLPISQRDALMNKYWLPREDK